MIQNIIKKAICIAVLIIAAGLILSPRLRESVMCLFMSAHETAIAKLEAQANDGDMALSRYEQAYREQANKLSSTIRLRDNAVYEIERAQRRAEEFRAAGKETQALLNERDVERQKRQHERACRRIEKLAPGVKKLREKMEIAREEVRIMRKNIIELSSMRDAMDDSGLQELLDKADQNIANLNSQLNAINAEIEVLELIDE